MTFEKATAIIEDELRSLAGGSRLKVRCEFDDHGKFRYVNMTGYIQYTKQSSSCRYVWDNISTPPVTKRFGFSVGRLGESTLREKVKNCLYELAIDLTLREPE